MKKIICPFLFLITLAQATPLLRGFNLSMYSPDTGELTREDFQQIKDIGATIVRLDFSKNYLMEKAPPYQFNEDNFERLHKYIRWAEEIGLKVIIDPHTFPGTILPWTIMGHDQFWFDKHYKDLVVKLWRRIARECSSYGDVIWAYDLINEPHGRGQQPGQVWDLNELYKKLIREIRIYDDSHGIILMFHHRDFFDYAKPPDWYSDPLSRLIYSPHFYWPQQYTHQGLSANLAGSERGQKYPDPEKAWTKEAMRQQMAVYKRFKEAHNVEAWDEDGEIIQVEFYANDEKIGWDETAPYSLEWNVSHGSFRIRAKAIDNSGAFRHARPVDIAVQPALPNPWINRDIGKTAAPCCAWRADDLWHIHAAEDDLYSPDNGYHAVLQPFEGDIRILVRVESREGTEPQNMAGLIMLDSGKEPAQVVRFGFFGDNHVRMQVFQKNGVTTSIQSEKFAYAPGWLKLIRRNNTFSAYYAKEKGEWQQIDAPILCDMPETVFAGMFVCASKDIFVNRAIFSNIAIQY